MGYIGDFGQDMELFGDDYFEDMEGEPRVWTKEKQVEIIAAPELALEMLQRNPNLDISAQRSGARRLHVRTTRRHGL